MIIDKLVQRLSQIKWEFEGELPEFCGKSRN